MIFSIKELKKQKRENPFLLFLDNPKVIEEAISAGHKPLYLLKEKDKAFINLEHKFDEIIEVKKSVLEDLCDVKTPQGVLAIVIYIPNVVEPPSGNYLVLDNVQDAGNVGTLIRSALGADFKYIYLIDCCKPYNSKVVRSSMGAIFKTKVISLSKEGFLSRSKDFYNLCCADMSGKDVYKTNLKTPLGIVIGNEGNGVSSEIVKLCKEKIKIPMNSNLESLNAGVSGSILMFQIRYGGEYVRS